MKDLARLEAVELREAWESEARDFTPWLAREENIALLGDVLGMDLQVESTEKDVGPFRADILCRENASDHIVLIENQLERTDHTHLGQIITYAAGLKAVTIVWIASSFTNEHRAAIDWLNEISGDEFRFFGLELELWRIGDSHSAPKFNVVSKPNTWTKGIRGGMTDTETLRYRFWEGFMSYIETQKTRFRPRSASKDHWLSWGIGHSSFVLLTVVGMKREKFLGCSLIINGPQAGQYFHQLERERTAIEAEMGEELEWRELPTNKQSQIRLRISADTLNEADRPSQYGILLKKLELFHEVFSKRVKKLAVAGEQEGDADV